jgi:hypothetical protein
MQTFEFGSVPEILSGLAFITLIGSVLGFITYLMMAYPHLRREEYRTPLGCSQPLSAGVGACIALGLTAYYYFSDCNRFSRVDVTPSEIHLRYPLPPHTVTLRRADVEQFRPVSDLHKTGRFFRLQVRTRHRKTYYSVKSRQRPFEQTFAALKEALEGSEVGKLEGSRSGQ